jgi:hypothetical protein
MAYATAWRRKNATNALVASVADAYRSLESRGDDADPAAAQPNVARMFQLQMDLAQRKLAHALLPGGPQSRKNEMAQAITVRGVRWDY